MILIVDDHAAVRKALRDWIETVFPHFDVLQAASGEEAIAVVQERPPQVVVMDVGLPKMSGIEATRQIKAIAPATQVVILTIHEDEAYRADAASAGVAAYIPKRTMQTELVPTLKSLLAAWRQTS
jgi:DNA-binding NarL/FixJ family response regulator